MKHKTLRGVMVDMALFSADKGDQIAVGNAAMNAAGDKLGAGGKVVKTRDQLMSEYHQSPRAVKQVALRDLEKELSFPSPAEAVSAAKTAASEKADTAKPKRKLKDEI